MMCPNDKLGLFGDEITESMEDIEKTTVHESRTSKKRIIGAALFGFILGNFIFHAFDYTIPTILAMVKKLNIEVARLDYESSSILGMTLHALTAFFAAGIAAFWARKKGILVGLLANSAYILIYAILLVRVVAWGTDAFIGNLSLQLYIFLNFLFIILASIFGGVFGEKFYLPSRDLDLGKAKLTIFGIRWLHYFWILPFIFYPFIASFIIVVYAGILTLLADLYFAIHPSLWINIAWWFYFFIVPGLIVIAGYVAFGGFARFYKVMEYKQIKSKGWKKFGQVVLYGIGAPSLSYLIAVYSANLTHNMPRPISGDWKIGLIVILGIPAVGFIIYFFSRIKQK